MSYATYEDYVEYGGKEEADVIDIMLEESSININKACYGRIEGIGFENLTVYQQDLIKRAVCTQVDFVTIYGEFIDSPMSGFSAGSISMSFKDTAKSVGGALISNKALGYLDSTGLTSRRL
ncbi:hypothetical protein J3A84_04845 [Proteiniclasticum sp. SCR006]|uniref:Uncharacterized protein n=1 Tax=Proteiniclasticum aestuarii TaxID=2817862 RepID=A0A939HBN7_9CLOT|nr:hypothetical protein [Proteiniclasticum aestuarii]MBO1264368.1 hypothetical protein [Proteiniclasticum aestuarii]